MNAPRVLYMHTLNLLPARWTGNRLVLSDRNTGPAQAYRTLRTLTNHIAKDSRQRHRRGESLDRAAVRTQELLKEMRGAVPSEPDAPTAPTSMSLLSVDAAKMVRETFPNADEAELRLPVAELFLAAPMGETATNAYCRATNAITSFLERLARAEQCARYESDVAAQALASLQLEQEKCAAATAERERLTAALRGIVYVTTNDHTAAVRLMRISDIARAALREAPRAL